MSSLVGKLRKNKVLDEAIKQTVINTSHPYLTFKEGTSFTAEFHILSVSSGLISRSPTPKCFIPPMTMLSCL